MKKNRFLIFGTGFVAENYIHHLYNSDSDDLRIKVIFNRHKLQFQHKGVEYVHMNDVNISFVEEYKPNYVLCVQGNSFVPAGINVRDSMTANSLKTMEFLEKLSQADCQDSLEKILVIGSASEYGKFYQKPINEDFPLHATSLYGLSKICLYNSSMYYFDKGLPVVHVRQFNTVGPQQRDCFVLPSFCKQVVKIEKGMVDPVVRVGDLTQERDFIDVRDTCRCYSLLFENGRCGETYNVSSGQCISIKELLVHVVSHSRIDGDVEVVTNEKLLFKDNRLSKKLHADISKISRLGFSTKYSLEQTVISTLDYWRKNV